MTGRYPMRALSIQQPWASAIIAGAKPVENRTWTTSSLPAWIAVHASGKLDPAYGSRESEAWQVLSALWDYSNVDMPRGRILGAMRVAAVVDWRDGTSWDRDRRALPARAIPWAIGPYCWVISRVVRLDTPIPCTGRLGLWPVPVEVHRALTALIEESR